MTLRYQSATRPHTRSTLTQTPKGGNPDLTWHFSLTGL